MRAIFTIWLIVAGFAFTLARGTQPLDVQVDGEGLMRFLVDGRIAFAKRATLTVEDGVLCFNHARLMPRVSVPGTPDRLDVDLDGRLLGTYGGQRRLLGRIVLAMFSDEAALVERDGFLVSELRPTLGNPGEGTCGVIRSGSDVRTTKAVVQDVIRKEPLRVAPSAASESVTITVRPESVVEGEAILLGEIAEIRGPKELCDRIAQVCVGEQPVVGYARGIDRARIVARLRGAGFPMNGILLSVPAGATVKRKGQSVPHAEFERIAIAAAQEKFGGNWQPAPTVAAPPDQLEAPLGALELRAEVVTGNATSARVTIGVYVGGKRLNSRTVVLQGSAGPIVIARNQQVSIRVRSNGAVVELSGSARNPARIGEQVEVRTNQGVTLTGIAIAEGVVEVKL
jgi:hypothetical protein